MRMYRLKAKVILDKGRKMEEDYGDTNSGTDKNMITLIQDYLLPEWNETAEKGYGKTLHKLWKIDNETKSKTLIYYKDANEILTD